MGQQPELGGERPPAVRIEQVVGADVVLVDVQFGRGLGLRDGLNHVGGYAAAEPLRQPGLGPLPPRPMLALGQPLPGRGQGEVQQHDEGQLVGEKVVAHVGRRFVGREDFIQRQHRPAIEVRLQPEVRTDLAHVPVELLQQAAEAVEHRVEGFPVARKVVADEGREGGLVAVLRPPEPADLLEPPPDPRSLVVAIQNHELLHQRPHVAAGPGGRWLRGAGRIAAWRRRDGRPGTDETHGKHRHRYQDSATVQHGLLAPNS